MKSEYFVQVNFVDTDKFGEKFINTFKSDDETKIIVFINTNEPARKFKNDEELSKMEKMVLMMRIGDKELLKKIAGDDEDLNKIADSVSECLDDDPLIQEVVNKVKSMVQENVSED